ncbi:MAG TPA: 3-hydroxyacyl-[acyl-carrier-protein] dehydratase FabZ [Elusimicrobia bacterium]|nr:3-hydroxyacyl-[acyl-carrier-protein] dehydratase FabZ [Elusimicrobiota bacterium]HBT61894.1 3-hydroxyacyl-[acyl-carrier-protein] dehydratase FabZ [Elusimicrobiota bacterium]
MSDPEAGAPEATAFPLRTLDTKAIRKAIPHRYPFLLIDRVDILEEDKKAVGTKCVTVNEPFFPGHFPEHPVMPGVLIIEAMAQTAAAMMLSKPAYAGKLAYFMGIDGAKFRQPVFPGSVLKLHLEALRLGRAGKFRGQAIVEGKLAAEAEILFALVDQEK